MRRAAAQDDGFTLIELLLSMTILGVILGSISSALIVFLKNAEYTLERDDHSGGAALLASYLDRDLASAELAGTGASKCSGGNASNALILSWGEAKATVTSPEPTPSAGGTFAAEYYLDSDTAAKDGNPRFKLVRNYCVNGGAPEASTLVRNLRSGNFTLTGAPSGTCGSGATVVKAALSTYLDDTSSGYRYAGCLKGRLG